MTNWTARNNKKVRDKIISERWIYGPEKKPIINPTPELCAQKGKMSANKQKPSKKPVSLAPIKSIGGE